MATSLAWAGEPSIELRVKNGGEPTSALTYPSVVSPTAPRPDLNVTGTKVTITDFRDLIVSVNGRPDATTNITMSDGAGNVVINQDAFGLWTDQALTAKITAVAQNYEIIENECEGKLLGPPNEEDATCVVRIKPKATWWGQPEGNLRVSTGDYHFDVPLTMRAHHFDPLRLELSVVSGDPSKYDVNGTFTKGNLGDGLPAASAENVTFRVKNLSTEYATPPLATLLSNLTNFEFVSDGCGGASVPALGTCDMVVRGKAMWWGTWAGTLTVTASPVPDGDPDITLTAPLAGTSHHFDPPRLQISTAAGDPDHVDVVGPTQPSYSSNMTLRVKNLSTEYPTHTLSTSVLAATTGPGTFEFVTNGCQGAVLAMLGTCDTTIRAKATWWGNLASSYTVGGNSEAGNISANRGLAGRAYHFDLPRPTIALVSGSPASMDVYGWARTITSYGPSVTYRVTNESTEETTEPLSLVFNNPTNFEFTTNGCASAQLGVGATCDVVVRSKATQNGYFTGTMTVNNHTRPSVNMAGTGYTFYTYSWSTNGWSGCTSNPYWGGWGSCSTSCGPGTQYRNCEGTGGTEYRSVWCTRSDGSNMGDVSNTYPGCESWNRPSTSQGCYRGCSGSNSQSCYEIYGCSFNWVDWTGWSGCSVSCGGGVMYGSQNCKRSDGQYVEWWRCNATWGGTWGASANGSTYTWATNCNTHSCCVPNNQVYAYGGCSASCGGGWRTRYWTNGCGSNWTDSEQCNTHSCQQTFDTNWYGACGNGSASGWCSCALQNQRDMVCQQRGYGRAIGWNTVCAPAYSSNATQCAGGGGCFYNQNSCANVICTSITCTN